MDKEKNVNLDSNSKSMIECLSSSSEIDIVQIETKNMPKSDEILYCVGLDDTIERVAAKFMMTPTNLMAMNKLLSRVLFVNQKLKVRKPSEADEISNLSGVSNGGKEACQQSVKSQMDLDEISANIMLMPLHYEEDHLKVVSKYITDSDGVIKGKLLLTSVFFTFIPAFSDPVIMEYGAENYTIHLPNNKIACLSMYNNSEMMAYKRSQRKDMISKIVPSTGQVEWVSMTSNSAVEKLASYDDTHMADNTRSYSLDDFLNRTEYVQDIETMRNLKFIDHKYLCLVASPRYRKIKAGSQTNDEYWFIVPTDCAQALMDYVLTHAKTKYDIGADVEEIKECSNETVVPEPKPTSMVKRNSFAKVEDVNGKLLKGKNKLESAIKKLRSKSIQWEIVNTDIDFQDSLGDISEEIDSKILDSSQIKELMRHLPAETIGATWELIYTTERDGWSLSTLYRNVYNSTRGCCLLLIKDSNAKIFGAMCSSYIRMSSSFYGNGTTFVFRWNPDFEKFSYSRKNDFFLFGQPDYFSIGCSNCNNALRIEKSLFNGFTQSCETFDNPPLNTSGTFEVFTLEVWSFY